MQRKVLLAALVALVALGGCAQRDPNLLVRGLSEFGRSAGDYTLTLKTYELDAEGGVKLSGTDEASLRGFVVRTLGSKGYTLKSSGPARYAVDAYLLCADTRKASLGFVAEELRLPAEAVGPGYSKDIHYWLPDSRVGMGSANKDALDRRDSSMRRRSGGVFDRPAEASSGGTPLGGQEPAYCQGRVLLTLTPAGSGPQREVFVEREATGNCPAVPDCPLRTCGMALERSLVDVLERGF